MSLWTLDDYARLLGEKESLLFQIEVLEGIEGKEQELRRYRDHMRTLDLTVDMCKKELVSRGELGRTFTAERQGRWR